MAGARPVLGTLSQYGPPPAIPPKKKDEWSQHWDSEWDKSRNSSDTAAAVFDDDPFADSPPPILTPTPTPNPNPNPNPSTEHQPATTSNTSTTTTTSKNAHLPRPPAGPNTALSSLTGVGAQGIAGYLNLTVTRHSHPNHSRTLALPPSTLSTLTFAKLARILQLDIPTERSRWAGAAAATPTPSSDITTTRSLKRLARSHSTDPSSPSAESAHSRNTSVSAALGSLLKTVFLPGAHAEEEHLRRKRKALQTEDRKYPYRIYAKYQPSPATPTTPTTTRPSPEQHTELWLPLEPFSFPPPSSSSSPSAQQGAQQSQNETPTHSLYAALLHSHLRSLIANGGFWHLDIRSWSESRTAQSPLASDTEADDRQHVHVSSASDQRVLPSLPLPFPRELDDRQQGRDEDQDEEYDPEYAQGRLPKIGRGLSRLSMSIGAWWNGTTAGQQQRQRRAGGAPPPPQSLRAERERAEWEERSRTPQPSHDDELLPFTPPPPPPPPPPRRRLSLGKGSRGSNSQQQRDRALTLPGSATRDGLNGPSSDGLKRNRSFLARLFGGSGAGSGRSIKRTGRGPISLPADTPRGSDDTGTSNGTGNANANGYSDLLYRPQPHQRNASSSTNMSSNSKNGRAHRKANPLPERNPFEDDDDDVEFSRQGLGEEDAVPIAVGDEVLLSPTVTSPTPGRGRSSSSPAPIKKPKQNGGGAGEASFSATVDSAPIGGGGEDTILNSKERKNREKKERKEREREEKERKKEEKKNRRKDRSEEADDEDDDGGVLGSVAGEGLAIPVLTPVLMPKSGFGTGLPDSVVARAKAEREASKANTPTTPSSASTTTPNSKQPWAARLPFRRQTTLSELLDSNERAHLQERDWLAPMPVARTINEDGESVHVAPAPAGVSSTQNGNGNGAGGMPAGGPSTATRFVERLDLYDDAASMTTASILAARQNQEEEEEELRRRRSQALPPADWDVLGKAAGSRVGWSSNGHARVGVVSSPVGGGGGGRDPFADPGM
ncbi:hypothetical protein CF328_g7727 [Tilletia controversa]|nr:hypothetical protein CF328_g7727 [Tilletia controversa]